MKSAVEVIANVHSSLGFIWPPNRSRVLSNHSLRQQKKAHLRRLFAAVEQAARPLLVGALQVHGVHDIDEHACGEEATDLRGRQAGDSLDIRHEIAEAVPYDLADLRVVAGGVRLELRLQARAVGDQLVN